MTDHKKSTVLVIDNGLFCELAVTLSKSFGKVLYWSPWVSGFPKSNQLLIGEGVPGITRVNSFWPILDQIDLFVFPDVYFGDLQLHLEKLGKRVWGGRMGEELELFRVASKQHMAKAGIPIGPYAVIKGLDNLRAYLKEHDNVYIKISRTRGDMETFKSKNYKLIEPKLDELEFMLGAKKKIMEFVVEDAIDDAVEIGYDGYSVDGKFPGQALWGIEAKDEGLIAQAVAYSGLPKQAIEVNTKIGPTLQAMRHRGFMSTEIRVAKNGVGYVIDPCMRMGSPPGELYQTMISNWADILWEGAMGTLVDPKIIAPWGAELLILSNWADKNWQAIEFPASIREHVKLRNLTVIDGKYYVVPQQVGLPEIGAVVATGKTMDEAIKNCIKLSEQVEGHYIEFEHSCLEKIKGEFAKVVKLTAADKTAKPEAARKTA